MHPLRQTILTSEPGARLRVSGFSEILASYFHRAKDRTPPRPHISAFRKSIRGAVRSSWGATPRAQNYRPFYEDYGRDPDFIPLSLKLDVLLENVPATGTLKFCVEANNQAGDSPKSESDELPAGHLS